MAPALTAYTATHHTIVPVLSALLRFGHCTAFLTIKGGLAWNMTLPVPVRKEVHMSTVARAGYWYRVVIKRRKLKAGDITTFR